MLSISLNEMGLVSVMFRNNFPLRSSQIGFLLTLKAFLPTLNMEMSNYDIYEICSSSKIHSLLEQQSKVPVHQRRGFVFSS